MTPHVQDPGAELEQFRAYLRLLARLGLGPQLRAKVDLSGVVQETLVKAFRAWEQFRVLPEGEKSVWLRKVLANHLKDVIANLKAQKRDVLRERSLEAALDASSARLEVWLAADADSPSAIAMLHENQLRLAQALEQLSEDRRTAVELRSFQGLSLEETAREMGKSKDAVAQLYSRGLKDLSTLLDHE
jgi:RNA polymerase sigma-70 factor (ECF subfamily)